MDQTVVISALVEIAALEAERAQCRATLAGSLKRMADLEELCAEAGAEAADLRKSGRRGEAGLRGRELEIRAVEASIADRQRKLATAGDPARRSALEREIQVLSRQCDRMLDEACGELTRGESLAAASAEADRESEQLEARREAETAALKEAAARAELALQEIDPELERLAGMLPAEFARQIRRHWQRGDDAVVAVRDAACGGCLQQLPPQMAASAELGKAVVRCPSCSRFVVHKRWR